MVLRSCRLEFGVPTEQTHIIMQCLQRCTIKCDAHLEVNAYDVEPIAKRARRAVARALALQQQLPPWQSPMGSEPKRPAEPYEDRIHNWQPPPQKP